MVKRCAAGQLVMGNQMVIEDGGVEAVHQPHPGVITTENPELAPNLVLWTGGVHLPVLTLKDDG